MLAVKIQPTRNYLNMISDFLISLSIHYLNTCIVHTVALL